MASIYSFIFLLRMAHSDFDLFADRLVEAAMEQYARLEDLEVDKLRRSFHLLRLCPTRAALKVRERIRVEERRDYFALLANLEYALGRFGSRGAISRFQRFKNWETEHLARWVRVAGLIRSPKAFDAIARLSDHPSFSVRYDFEAALPHIGDPRGRRLLYAIIESTDDPDEFELAIINLGEFRCRDSQISNRLVGYLFDPKGPIATLAGQDEVASLRRSHLAKIVLLVLAQQEIQAMPSYRRLLSEPGIEVEYRCLAIESLYESDSGALRRRIQTFSKELLALLDLDEIDLRTAILLLLARDRSANDFALPTLIKYLGTVPAEDSLPWLETIFRIDPRNEPAAKRALELFKDSPGHAMKILKILHENAAPLATLLDATLRFTQHADDDIRFEAVGYLSKYFPHPEVIQRMRSIARLDSFAKVREVAQAYINSWQ